MERLRRSTSLSTPCPHSHVVISLVLPPGGRDHDVTGNDDIGTELVAHRSIVGCESRFREALAESDVYPRSTGSGSQSR